MIPGSSLLAYTISERFVLQCKEVAICELMINYVEASAGYAGKSTSYTVPFLGGLVQY